MKKLLLTTGAIATTLASMTTVISCGNSGSLSFKEVTDLFKNVTIDTSFTHSAISKTKITDGKLLTDIGDVTKGGQSFIFPTADKLKGIDVELQMQNPISLVGDYSAQLMLTKGKQISSVTINIHKAVSDTSMASLYDQRVDAFLLGDVVPKNYDQFVDANTKQEFKTKYTGTDFSWWPAKIGLETPKNQTDYKSSIDKASWMQLYLLGVAKSELNSIVKTENNANKLAKTSTMENITKIVNDVFSKDASLKADSTLKANYVKFLQSQKTGKDIYYLLQFQHLAGSPAILNLGYSSISDDAVKKPKWAPYLQKEVNLPKTDPKYQIAAKTVIFKHKSTDGALDAVEVPEGFISKFNQKDSDFASNQLMTNVLTEINYENKTYHKGSAFSLAASYMGGAETVEYLMSNIGWSAINP